MKTYQAMRDGIAKDELNPRYKQYARDCGRDPIAQYARDCGRWPGGSMVAFICWSTARWHEWRRLNGFRTDDYLSVDDRARHDEWIAARPVTGDRYPEL